MGKNAVRYWLFKSEPTTFSIDDLRQRSKQTEHWDGVRNYQVRNMMRTEMKKGDKGFFYHSSCAQPGIVGVIEVVKEAYPDFTAWDSQSHYYDAKSTPDDPRWFMVDVKLVKKFTRIITLSEMRCAAKLKNMQLLRKANRLSITPVSAEEWRIILAMAED